MLYMQRQEQENCILIPHSNHMVVCQRRKQNIPKKSYSYNFSRNSPMYLSKHEFPKITYIFDAVSKIPNRISHAPDIAGAVIEQCNHWDITSRTILSKASEYPVNFRIAERKERLPESSEEAARTNTVLGDLIQGASPLRRRNTRDWAVEERSESGKGFLAEANGAAVFIAEPSEQGTAEKRQPFSFSLPAVFDVLHFYFFFSFFFQIWQIFKN